MEAIGGLFVLLLVLLLNEVVSSQLWSSFSVCVPLYFSHFND